MEINPTPQDSDPLTSGVETGSLDEISQPQTKGWRASWERILKMGLGDLALRVGTGLALVALILLVVWVMGHFYQKGDTSQPASAAMAAALPTSTPTVKAPIYTASVAWTGIRRLVNLHTDLPSRPRFDISTYVVQEGDTIFDIAKKFGLKPETILWGNYNTLIDDPHRLRPGITLNILPEDGLLYEWHAGDGLNGVSKYFGVTPEDIINWPSNHLTKEAVGDYAAPNIKPGTMLFVPGGTREFVTWSAPRITRQNPAVAKLLGPGACGTVVDGAVGSGSFVWPTPGHLISGFNYSPETNHFGIDLGGSLGTPIYAADSGVVVYAGWNDWGYGNVIVIDHGGWQTLYAHIMEGGVYVGCGQSVGKGDIIAGMGSTGNSTGPHLHFEMLYGSTHVNPLDVLP